jgi:HK97 gp10 family phage protein
MAVVLRVKMNKLPDVQANLKPSVEAAGEKYLDEVDRIASGTVPVDTGNLKNSKTRSKGRIAWTAEYAGFVNYGTRFMSAQPFATDASEKALPQLQQALSEIEGSLLS